MSIVLTPQTAGISNDYTVTTAMEKVADMINRTDLNLQITEAFNMVIRSIERKTNFEYMLNNDQSGQSISTDSLELTLPDRFKSFNYVKCDVDGILEPVRKMDESSLLTQNSLLSLSFPMFYAISPNEQTMLFSRFEGTYNIWRKWFEYSLKLDATNNPTHWILTNYPEVLLYGAALEMMPYSKDKSNAKVWELKYGNAVVDLKRAEWVEEKNSDPFIRGAYE